MRILHINKFGYPKGGAENYMLRTALRQADNGDIVGVLGAEVDRSNLPAHVRRFNVDVPDYHALSGTTKVRAAAEVLWSKPAAHVVANALDEFRPDVVHLHNYAHQLSSSILKEISSRRIPSIYTAHDYKLICPAYVANVENADCFACAEKVSSNLLTKRCHHGSVPWSAVVGLEALIVRTGKLVPNVIIGPSQYMTDALRSSWLSGHASICLLRNPVEASGRSWIGSENYLLYVGRLSREKGVSQLIDACAALGVPIKIAGDGPLRAELEKQASALRSNVEFLGHIDQNALSLIRQQCAAQVLSSEWPENAPLSALEAAVDGTPLIVSARGGLPEFANIGAKVAVIQGFNDIELGRALGRLPDLTGDLEKFRRETNWLHHLAALNDIYLDAQKDGQ